MLVNDLLIIAISFKARIAKTFYDKYEKKTPKYNYF